MEVQRESVLIVDIVKTNTKNGIIMEHKHECEVCGYKLFYIIFKGGVIKLVCVDCFNN